MWKWLNRVFPSGHQWAARHLSAYLDDELPPPERTRVEAHLKECHACMQELRSLRWAVQLTAQMPMLKAPPSFLITEGVAEPHRAPLSLAYVYLRGATLAVGALLLVVLAGDVLMPSPPSPRVPASQTMIRKALPVAEEAAVEEVIREIPVETVVAAGKEVVKEVQVEKEIEKPALSKAPELIVGQEGAMLVAATPTPAEEAARIDLEAKQAAPQMEGVSQEEMEQESVILMTPLAEGTPETTLAPTGGGAKDTQAAPAEKRGVAPTAVIPTPTSERVAPTATLPSPRHVVEKEVAPSPPTAVMTKATEPAIGTSPPWRSALRFVEVGLAVLMIVLVGSTLTIRARYR